MCWEFKKLKIKNVKCKRKAENHFQFRSGFILTFAFYIFNFAFLLRCECGEHLVDDAL
jgi:hypothetical protein